MCSEFSKIVKLIVPLFDPSEIEFVSSTPMLENMIVDTIIIIKFIIIHTLVLPNMHHFVMQILMQ